MKKTILPATFLLAGAILFSSCNNGVNDKSINEMDSAAYKDSTHAVKMRNAMMLSMSRTMDKMHDMKMTGDFDLDFANMMISHHRAAIDMSETEIVRGTNEQVKTMAKAIITAQNAEIGHLEAFIKSYQAPATKMETAEMQNMMRDMMDKMNNMELTGNTDKDFIMMMIPHHEGAIKMAEYELTNGKQAELKKMAQKMITDQNKEISQFKAWLTNQK